MMQRATAWTSRVVVALVMMVLPAISAAQEPAPPFKVGDSVEVLTGFGWTPARIIEIRGKSYRVMAVGAMVTKDYPAEVRRLGAGAKPSPAPAPKGGVPPKPGLTSCAGKFEGRYATSGAGMASFTMTFRSGKATMTDAGGNDEVFECWTGGGRILLHQPGHPNMDMSIDINDDGSLQTPIGEIRKKGS